MKCQRCGAEKLAEVSAQCDDRCQVSFPDGKEQEDGYVPSNLGIGGGDYIEIAYCLNCGQIQGKFPVVIEEDDENPK